MNPGFNTENVLSVSLRPNTPNPAEFYDQVTQRVATLTGVASAGMISRLPLTNGGTSLNVFPVGPAAIPNDKSIQANWRLIHGDYFRTMEIPVLRGHGFETLSRSQARASIVVSTSLARALWGDADPLGRQVNLGSGNNPLTVIGVVGDVRSHRLNVAPWPSYYLSIHRFTFGPQSLVIRTTHDTAALVAALRQTIKEIDPTVPLFGIRTMDEQRSESLAQERLVILLLSSFAGVALFLAALGTYGVVTFTVQQRTSEIGIRLAIGAQAHDILRLVIGQGLRLAAIGVVLGLAGAFAASRVLSALLYDPRATDNASYVVATGALAAATLLASYLPARRATKVDPMVALRAE